ncbi:MAG: cytochrome c family protein [Novosphingobium sp.]|uniref:c-type cytochrome n=1 Tax=Novosphingobium sp. TaxID=1874826 RepID=UPI0030185D07
MKFSKTRFGLVALGAAALAALTAAGAAQAAGTAGDAGRGKTVFARCAACHDLNTGAIRMGPSLKGVVGRKAGTFANFSYSAGMKGKGVVWGADTLDAFLTAPMKYVPGTRMAFPGLSNAQDRADVIAYLKVAAK